MLVRELAPLCAIATNSRPPVAESSEIEELRAQLKSLEERVRQPSPRKGSEPKEPIAQSLSDSVATVIEQAKEIAEEWHLPEASEKLGEFLSALGDDIKQSPPRALIAAFLAGFVAGKVVSR